MSKNRSRKSRGKADGATNAAATASVAAAVVESANNAAPATPSLTLDQLQERGVRLAGEGLWDELLELCGTPLASVSPADREEAEVWMLRARVHALRAKVPEGNRLDNETAPGIKDALSRLRHLAPAFHELPEFDIYLDTTGYEVADSLERFDLLKVACEHRVNAKWLRLLRDKVLRLTDRDGDEEEEGATEPELERALKNLPAHAQMFAIAERALERALLDSSLSPTDRLEVQVLLGDVFSRTCEPWHHSEAAKRIRALPSLSPEQVALIPESDFPVRPGQRLTPDAWAFLWELRNAWRDYPQLLSEYPAKLGVDLADGLRTLVRSAIAADFQERDRLFVEGTELLLRAQDSDREFLTESVVLAGPQGHYVAWVGHLGVNVEPTSELLLHMYEPLCESFERAPQLLVLLHLLRAKEDYGGMDVEDGLKVPGLSWLAQRSKVFAFEVAGEVPNRALAWVLFLDTLCWTIQQQQALPRRHFWTSAEQEQLKSEEEAVAVLEALELLVPLRSLAQAHHVTMWTSRATDIFDSLVHVNKPEILKRTLELARVFESDLQGKSAHFVLGYLEQKQGEAELALEHYLAYLQTCDNADSAVNNTRILLNGMTELEQLENAVDLIDSCPIEKQDAAKKELLRHARARRQELNDQEQFERTALNRWPTVTGPARAVLSALASVDNYRDFDTLGRYAGMDGTWAERHYRKLVELGMVIKTAKGYRINSHIEPLLAQENKHAVVGRIVTASGTSAVKPVFNSGREFTIYQCMVQLCPNHLVFPNCSLQSIMSFERIKPLVTDDDFSYYLKASVDIVVVSTTTYLPMLAIEVDSVWHDTERQQKNDEKKDRLFAAAGIPFLRLRPVGKPSESTIRGQVAEHLDELVKSLRSDLPGFDQARRLIEDLSSANGAGT